MNLTEVEDGLNQVDANIRNIDTVRVDIGNVHHYIWRDIESFTHLLTWPMAKL